jgi:putative FmdB family regulatory protein
MPLYEYKCDSCGATFEVIQKFSDLPVTACRVCGQAVRKVLSAPAIQFKGSGWYVTDYAKKGMSEPGRKNDNGPASSSSSSESSSKDSNAKESAAKDSGGKESGGKESSAKDSGAKDSGAKTTSDSAAATKTEKSDRGA